MEFPEPSPHGSPKETNAYVGASVDIAIIHQLAKENGLSFSRITRVLVHRALLEMLGEAEYQKRVADFTAKLATTIEKLKKES